MSLITLGNNGGSFQLPADTTFKEFTGPTASFALVSAKAKGPNNTFGIVSSLQRRSNTNPQDIAEWLKRQGAVPVCNIGANGC